MKKYFIAISILIVIFISACKSQETVKEDNNLLPYENKDLSISFKYPSNFKVYQSDASSLRIESDYKKEGAQLASVGMNINRINPQRETQEQIDSRLSPSGKSVLSREDKGNYELLKINDNEHYVLSDKGTFYIGDSTGVYKSTLEEAGLYQNYENKFNEIRNSIKII